MTVPAMEIVNPHGKLADLIKSATDAEIDPAKLRSFIAGHWKLVQTYAHAIHEDDIRTKAVAKYKSETAEKEWRRTVRGEPSGY